MGTWQTLVGGAPIDADILRAALSRAPRLVAVDGGADAVSAAGLVPDLVVGDLDSISDAARVAFADRLLRIPEQDSTDFAKARRSSPAAMTIAVGFIGARADHFLACLSELARGGLPCILLGREDCVFVVRERLSLDVPPGTRVSLWPMGAVRGHRADCAGPSTASRSRRTGASARRTRQPAR